jgi:hypothetical protein
MAAVRRRRDGYLVAALLITLLLWNVPFGWKLLYPFKLFATWLHEMSHGLVMLLTGAGLSRLELFADTSGLAYPKHGVTAPAQAVISNAGYMGTAFFGALFLVLGRTAKGARITLASIGAAMALSGALWVPAGFGRDACLVSGGVLGGIALVGGDLVGAFVLNLFAAQSCINAVLDIRILFGGSMYVNGQPAQLSDADAVAHVAGGPAALWAALWLVWSFGLFYAALRYLRLRHAENA